MDDNTLITQDSILSAGETEQKAEISMGDVNAVPNFNAVKQSQTQTKAISRFLVTPVVMSPRSKTISKPLPPQTALNNEQNGEMCEQQCKSVIFKQQPNAASIPPNAQALQEVSMSPPCQNALEIHVQHGNANSNISEEHNSPVSVAEVCEKLTCAMGRCNVISKSSTSHVSEPDSSSSFMKYFYPQAKPKFTPVKKYEDIVVTARMLEEAPELFDKIEVLPEELERAPEEFERLFGSMEE